MQRLRSPAQQLSVQDNLESSSLETGMNTMTFVLDARKFLLLLEGNVFFGNYLLFIFVIIIRKKIKAERFEKSFYDSKMLGKWQIQI